MKNKPIKATMEVMYTLEQVAKVQKQLERAEQRIQKLEKERQNK